MSPDYNWLKIRTVAKRSRARSYFLKHQLSISSFLMEAANSTGLGITIIRKMMITSPLLLGPEKSNYSFDTRYWALKKETVISLLDTGPTTKYLLVR